MARTLNTVGEVLYWTYANLAMYQYACSKSLKVYDSVCYSIREKQYKALNSGNSIPRDLYSNERYKLTHADTCFYCGMKSSDLTLDHVFPRVRGGSDSGDNLVYACQSCNSSKGKKDYFQWCADRGCAISGEVAQRYLKNAIKYSTDHDLLDCPVSEAASMQLPFDISAFPERFEL